MAGLRARHSRRPAGSGRGPPEAGDGVAARRVQVRPCRDGPAGPEWMATCNGRADRSPGRNVAPEDFTGAEWEALMSGRHPPTFPAAPCPRGPASRRAQPSATALRRAVLALVLAATPQPARADGTVRWTADGVSLCTATNNQQNPQIVADGAGGAIVTWEDRRNVTSDIFARRILANGATDPAWPAQGVPVCTAALNQTLP